LTFRDGWVPPDLEGRRWEDDQIVVAARFVRGLLDATAGSSLAGEAEVVCHGDLSPCNFVFVGGKPRFLIDFDRAHPGSRRSDLAYMGWCWLVGREDECAPALETRLRRLGLLLDAYELGERSDLARAILAEREEILESSRQRRNEAATAWVESEIEFVREHATQIDAAAAPARR